MSTLIPVRASLHLLGGGAKGMEFTHVILMGVGKDVMPLRFRLKNLSEEDARSALQRERSELLPEG